MFFRKAQPESKVEDDVYNKDWYFSFIKRWNEIFKTDIPSHELQEEYLYELSLRIRNNVNNKNLQLLNSAEIDKFWQGVAENLQYINDNTIIEYGPYYNSALKHFLLETKGNRLKTIYSPKDIKIETVDGTPFTQASERDVFIEMMSHDKRNNKLIIMGCTTFPFDRSTTNLVAVINGTENVLSDSGLYSDFKIFGETAYRKFPFRIEIDLANDIPLSIGFFLVSEKKSTKVAPNLHFNTRMSKLAGRITYWRFASFLATHTKKTIYVKKNNALEVFVRECAFLLAIATVWKRPRTAFLRIMYWVSKPSLSKRNIWMYADKIYKAGDNAEWLYRYAKNQSDNIDHHYVLRSDSPDVAAFEKDELPYLKYKTMRQRLLFLHSDILVFTHNNAPGYYRFAKANEVFFRGLYNYDIMYIQHGLTVQDTAWLFKKSEDDFKQYFIASKFEKDNLLRPEYGFKDDELVEAGATRYDGLKNNDQKNIIITPTWRTYLAPPGKDYGESRDAHQNFKNTDFFKIYNTLINNKRLIDTAKKLGYSITYLLHPVMSSQIDDFTTDGYVKVITANDDFNYQKAMTEGSLMVTDYSGVQFDFAYMNKPVVYFHPPKLPASYDEAVYKYENHALGDIVHESDELVDLVCEYMENDCKIKPKFKARVDEFFYHHDLNNSQRIYDHIRDWQKEVS